MNRRAYIFSENQKLNSQIANTKKRIHFPSKRTIILCYVEVILYGIFVVFICISIFENLTKKVGFQAILLGRKISRIALFCQFLRIFTIFKETSLLRDDPKSLEMDEIIVTACIQATETM